MPTPSAIDVATALRERLAAEYGDVAVVGEPTSNGQGFDSAIHFVQFDGGELPAAWRRPLVVRIKPRVEASDVAHHEAALHRWLHDAGYPVPLVLAVYDPGELTALPTQVIERAPGVMMIEAVKRTPWRARRLIGALAELHVRLHRLSTDGFPASMDLVDRRLRLPRTVAEQLGDPDLRRGLERVGALAPRLRDAPGVVCHGDFHPLNVLVDVDAAGTTMSVIDWSDAGIGDLHGDVARTRLLFEMAWIAASSAAERAVLRTVGPLLGRSYLRSYALHGEANGVVLDEGRLTLWRPTHLVHGWAQALAARAGLFDDGSTVSERLPERVVDELRRRFDEAIAQVA